MISAADIVCGLAWGDEAKGKITASLAATKNYNYVCRWAGGSNAGHTIYVNNKKYKTHLIPSGVFFGIQSVIGPGCVINLNKMHEELEYLEKNNFDTSLVRVSPRAHIVTEEHIEEDKAKLAQSLGTTSSGIAPCYSAKAARKGVLAKDVFDKKFLWDERLSGNILCEGAQGIWLDLDWGNYPYVTSSTTLPYAACSLGFPTQKIRNIFGAAKMYDTRSGVDPLFPEKLLESAALSLLGEIGQEYGVTTGRRRKVNWLDLTKLIKAVNITGTTHLIISKCDIIQEIGIYRMFTDGLLREFKSTQHMIDHIQKTIKEECPLIKEIKFSYSPNGV